MASTRSLAGESIRPAEGATAPETLRQKDREGDELLESGKPSLGWRAHRRGNPDLLGGKLSGPMTEGFGTAAGGTTDSI